MPHWANINIRPVSIDRWGRVKVSWLHVAIYFPRFDIKIYFFSFCSKTLPHLTLPAPPTTLTAKNVSSKMTTPDARTEDNELRKKSKIEKLQNTGKSKGLFFSPKKITLISIASISLSLDRKSGQLSRTGSDIPWTKVAWSKQSLSGWRSVLDNFIKRYLQLLNRRKRRKELQVIDFLFVGVGCKKLKLT